MPSEPPGQTRLAAHHDQHPTSHGPSRRQRKDQALGWKLNDHSEALLAMSEKWRAQYLEKAGPRARMALHNYHQGNSAREQLEMMNR